MPNMQDKSQRAASANKLDRYSLTLIVFVLFVVIALVWQLVSWFFGIISGGTPEAPPPILTELSAFDVQDNVLFFSALFPLMAVGFGLTRVRVRKKEIIQELNRDDLWTVYDASWKQPKLDADTDDKIKANNQSNGNEQTKKRWDAFSKQVDERINEQYNLPEFFFSSFLVAAISALISFFSIDVLDKNASVVSDSSSLENLATFIRYIPAAFLGTYAGSILFLIKKFVTVDLRPAGFLQTGAILIAGTLTGAFVGSLNDAPYFHAAAFFVGLVAALQADFVLEFAKSQVARITKFQNPQNEIKPDLHKVVRNPELLESLNRLSVYSVRELARTDPLRLYFYVAKDHSVIVDLIDQAILFAEFPTVSDRLVARNVTSFSSLIQRYDLHQLAKSGAPSKEILEILDNGGKADRNIFATCQSLFQSGVYHGILGLSLYRYRRYHFGLPLTST